MFNCRTKDEILVCLKYWLQESAYASFATVVETYERTLEKSLDGDMTKLSSELDHDMRCDMLGSSSILNNRQSHYKCSIRIVETHL